MVCGRNMSTDQLFSNGGQANSFDQLRDQLKEKDEEVLYLYDNSTSRECNDVMRGLEENRQDVNTIAIHFNLIDVFKIRFQYHPFQSG